MNRIAFCGSLIVDEIKMISSWPEKGMLVPISSVSRAVGGSVCNSGIDLKTLDQSVDVKAFGKVGADDKGDFVVKTLSEHGLDVSGIARTKDVPTSFTDVMTVASTGERTFFNMHGADSALTPDDIDKASREMGDWCREQGWNDGVVGRLMVVFEEKAMNIHDHGFDDSEKHREVQSVRIKRTNYNAVLTVWDEGTQEPSIAVVAGDSDTAFEMSNRNMAGRGRGRLIVRELCDGVERNRYEPLNETTYHIPLFGKDAKSGENPGGGG